MEIVKKRITGSQRTIVELLASVLQLKPDDAQMMRWTYNLWVRHVWVSLREKIMGWPGGPISDKAAF